MKRCIIINWKWMAVAPCPEGGGVAPENIAIWKTDGGTDEVYCLNLPREEAAFEDEYDFYYQEPNQHLYEFIEGLEGTEVLLLLHKNAPHHYGHYDIDWFVQKGLANVATFGGGEDYIYDLQQPLGLIDQVGNFSQKAIAQGQKIKQAHFDGVWSHYNHGLKEALYEFSIDLYPYLLETTSAPIPKQLQQQASEILAAINSITAEQSFLSKVQQQKLAEITWNGGFLEALRLISEGSKNIDARNLRESIGELS